MKIIIKARCGVLYSIYKGLKKNDEVFPGSGDDIGLGICNSVAERHEI